MADYADRIKQLRIARHGLSQRTLSELCGLNHGAIHQYERRERVPSLTAAVAIADYFEVSLDYLSGRINF